MFGGQETFGAPVFPEDIVNHVDRGVCSDRSDLYSRPGGSSDYRRGRLLCHDECEYRV